MSRPSERELELIRLYAKSKRKFNDEEVVELETLDPKLTWKNMWFFGPNPKWNVSDGILVYRDPQISTGCRDLVVAGIRDMVDEIGLETQIRDGGYLADCGGRRNGIVCILNKSADPDWGFTTEGVMALYFGGNKQYSSFVRQLTKHEMGHFLSQIPHHDEVDGKEFGYQEPDDCVMYWRASTPYLCDRCRDAMVYSWVKVEDRTGQKVFRE